MVMCSGLQHALAQLGSVPVSPLGRGQPPDTAVITSQGYTHEHGVGTASHVAKAANITVVSRAASGEGGSTAGSRRAVAPSGYIVFE